MLEGVVLHNLLNQNMEDDMSLSAGSSGEGRSLKRLAPPGKFRVIFINKKTGMVDKTFVDEDQGLESVLENAKERARSNQVIHIYDDTKKRYPLSREE